MCVTCAFASIFHIIMKIGLGIGITMVIIGYMNAVTNVHDVDLSFYFRVWGIILIVVGTIILVMTLIGLVGSSYRNSCLLKTFNKLTMGLLATQIILFIVLSFFFDKETLSSGLKYSMQYYNKDKDIKTFWDLINTNLECCGVDSVRDWHDNIPNSCCKDLNINDVCHKELANEKPCQGDIVYLLKAYISVCFSVTGVLEVFCFATAFIMTYIEYDDDI